MGTIAPAIAPSGELPFEKTQPKPGNQSNDAAIRANAFNSFIAQATLPNAVFIGKDFFLFSGANQLLETIYRCACKKPNFWFLFDGRRPKKPTFPSVLMGCWQKFPFAVPFWWSSRKKTSKMFRFDRFREKNNQSESARPFPRKKTSKTKRINGLPARHPLKRNKSAGFFRKTVRWERFMGFFAVHWARRFRLLVFLPAHRPMDSVWWFHCATMAWREGKTGNQRCTPAIQIGGTGNADFLNFFFF
jgi:hypothetical protein